jgi:hypothetical protein
VLDGDPAVFAKVAHPVRCSWCVLPRDVYSMVNRAFPETAPWAREHGYARLSLVVLRLNSQYMHSISPVHT